MKHGEMPFGQRRTLCLLLVALSVAAFWRAAFTFFASDDIVYLARGEWTVWRTAFEVFAYPRGLAEVAFVSHRWIFGFQPFLYHIVPFGLHILNAVLAYKLIRWALPDSELTAAIASLLFILHPAAYTPMAWLSQGFETVPCLTFTLGAAHLSVMHLERRGSFALPAAMLLMVVGIAFKSNIVLLPAYLGGLGLIFVSRASRGRDRRRALFRVALTLIPVALFDLWFVSEILWRLPHMSHPAYARDVTATALAGSYEQLLRHTFNVLPVFRTPLGYQDAIPAGFGAAGTAVMRVVIAAIGAGLVWMALRSGHAVFVVAMSAIVVGGLSFAAPFSQHLQDYYSYFVLPAACGLLALPLSALVRSRWPRPTLREGVLATAALVLYAFVVGTVLHPANRLVRQAAAVRAVDEFVRTAVALDEELVFLPPNEVAHADTVGGASIRVLHPGKNVSVRFPSSDEGPTLSRSTARSRLLGVEDLAGRGPRVYEFAVVQWSDAGTGPYLERARKIVQRFEVPQAGRVSEVHIRLTHFGRGCLIRAGVFEVTSDGSDPGREFRVQVGGAVTPCADDGVQIVPVEGARQPAGTTYELELSAAGDATPVLFHVAPVPAGLVPFIESPAERRGSPPIEAKVLAFRVVVDRE